MRFLRALLVTLAAIAVMGADRDAVPRPSGGDTTQAQRADPAQLPDLVAGLRSGDPAVRERAAEGLAELAAAGMPRAIETLVPLVHHSDSNLRSIAGRGLASAGGAAVPVLVAALREEGDDQRRARVATLLGRMGLFARDAIPELRRALQDPDSLTAGQAAYALGNARAREAVDDLVGAYAASRTVRNQSRMIRALRTIGSDQGARAARESLVPSVVADLRAGDAATRAAAVAYAGALLRAAGTGDGFNFPAIEDLAALVPELTVYVEQPDDALALQAIGALALLGPDAGAAVPALGRALEDPQRRHQAMRALRRIATPQAERLVAARLAFEKLDGRIRISFHVGDHQRRVVLSPFWVTGTAKDGIRMSVRFLHPGRQPRRPEHVVVGLESLSTEARFENLRSVVWRTQDSRIVLHGIERSMSKSRTGVIENLSGLLRVEDFLVLANASSLQLRLADVDYPIAEQDRAALRHFASKVP